MVSSSLPDAKILSVRTLDNKDARWINLVQIEYQAPDGKVRTWEAMRRPTRPKDSPVDAVHIIATRQSPGGVSEHEVLLEKQFRPPAGKVVIEFPAGLVDPNETLEECALRELREETGYVGEVTSSASGAAAGLVLFGSPASSFSRALSVMVNIDPTLPENQNPQPKLEEGEFIDCFWVPLKELHQEIRRLDAEGFAIDGKVGAFAEGIEITKLWQQ
ncbi:NUDIX hydrolase domain-like protein [Lasiosphaeria hispida]|uniref:NUDIX hydrolase domain-like protein n=1 Tax=Lasiosphaeria hispida TaxID=260671 RepID=A0AAJ0MCN5_9PEZI|nr:NUDIX hydrolase domain-like protein [Lasiosphaeria hispida]